MKTTSKEQLLEQISDEFWQLDFNFEHNLLRSFNNTKISLKISKLGLSRTLNHPHFFVNENKAFLLETGIAIDLRTLKSIYLTSGKNQDFTILFTFTSPDDHMSISFNWETSHQLTEILKSVTHIHKELNDTRWSKHNLTCQCCLEGSVNFCL